MNPPPIIVPKQIPARSGLSQFLASFELFSPIDIKAIAAAFEVKTYKKHTCLAIGEISNYLTFVESGLLREFLMREEEEEEEEEATTTRDFVSEGHFHYSIRGFSSNDISSSGIEVLENATIWSIKKEDLQALCLELRAQDKKIVK